MEIMWAESIRRQGMSFVSGGLVGAILLSALIVSAGTLKGQIEGDMDVDKTATVKENLKVYSSGSSDFISGNDGDAWIKDQLEVDGDAVVSGKLGVGVSSPAVKLDVKGVSGSTDPVVNVSNEGTNTHTSFYFTNANSAPSSYRSIFSFRQSRGSLASKSNVSSGDYLGSILGAGWVTDSYYSCAGINFWVDGSVGSGDYPSRMTFETTPDAGGVRIERMRITNAGKVGIGNTSPIDFLTLNGAMDFQSGSDPGATTGYGKIYATGASPAEVWVRDGVSANGTQISSHKDPRDIEPDASSSFADPNVEMPFSFHHYNSLMGTGEVVDMAWLVRDVERITGKQYRHLYQLPQDQVVNLAEWQQKEVARLTQEAKEKILATTPEVEIPLAEAYVEVPEVEVVEATRTHTEYKLDLENLTVAQVEVAEKTLAEVPTGRMKRQIKEDIRFDPETGKLYRRRTLEEIDPGVVPVPDAPEWVKSRIPEVGK